jgi:hypothetical protein
MAHPKAMSMLLKKRLASLTSLENWSSLAARQEFFTTVRGINISNQLGELGLEGMLGIPSFML